VSAISEKLSDAAAYPLALRALPLRRWTILGLLLILEVLLISFRFHIQTASLAEVKPEWVNIWIHIHFLGQFGICMVGALLIFGGHQLTRSVSNLGGELLDAPFPWLPMVVHLAAFAAFFQLSIVVFEGDLQSSAAPVAWIGAWFTAGILLLASWTAAALPVSQWAKVARSIGKVLALGVLVALAALGAGQLADLLWRPLGQSTLWVVARLLGLFYANPIVQPSDFVVGTSSFTVHLAPACSGYEGIGLILAFLAAFMGWFRKELRFPQAFLLLPLGVAAIWLANAVRITALVAIGSSVSAPVAQGGFHSQAGWLAFNAVAFGICALAWNSPLFAVRAARARVAAEEHSNPAACYLVPFLVLVAATMITTALSSTGFDRLYPVRVLLVAFALGYFGRTYLQQGLLRWTWSWPPIAIGVLVFAVWMALEPLAATNQAETQASLAVGIASLSRPMALGWLLFRALGSIVTVPLAEELAFRGYLTRRLIAEDFASLPVGRFSWFSLVISSVLFGVLHGRWLAGTVAGMLFAAALYRRGRLMDAVVAHATANGLITAYVLSTGQWAFWS
jgi:exosortase E/protease (VPEID-CTERM system)